MINLDLKLNDANIKELLEHDYIDRNRYLKSLISILITIDGNEIIALDGDWGSGKTFFLKSLEYLINNDYSESFQKIDATELEKLKNEYMVFYYNAWENDDASSAMLSLIYKLVNDTCLAKEESRESSLPNIINAIIKFKTNGYIDLKELSDKKWTNKDLTDAIKTSEEIKEKFTELITSLIAEKKNKLLIIIDEIDRCKPTFAIDLLENIKHFYDDERVVFLIGTNNKQLGASINKVYGEKYDSYGYLDKFFTRTLELPNNYLEKYILAIDENESNEMYIFRCFREIARIKELSMRSYNRYFKAMNAIEKQLNLFYFNTSYKLFINHIFIPLAMCLKIQDKLKFYEFIKGNAIDEILNLINKSYDFYHLSERIVSSKSEKLLRDENNQKIVDENKKRKIIDDNIRKIYISLCDNKNHDDYELKECFNRALDIISMLV